jgi:hypothetical protein
LFETLRAFSLQSVTLNLGIAENVLPKTSAIAIGQFCNFESRILDCHFPQRIQNSKFKIQNCPAQACFGMLDFAGALHS